MRIWVETFAGHGGAEMLPRFRFDDRGIEVVDNLDQRLGPDDRYFKVRGGEGNLYILCLDEARAEWELTMYRYVQSQAVPANLRPQRAR